MFPPLVMLPAGLLMFAAAHGTLQALAGPGPLAFSWRAWVGAASGVLFMLLMRVFDELKDVETDLRLGQAGDPRYKDRPIVTGAVRIEDIRLLRWVVTGLLFALNAPLGWPLPGAAFLLVYGFSWLSFKWFFWPAVSRNLLLAFATHNPLTAAVVLYVVAVFAGEAGSAALDPLATALLVVGLWLPVAAWETSRKIRVPEDETAYQTYSLLLGWKVAALLPLVISGGGALALGALAVRAGFTPVFLLALGLAWALLAGGCLRFRLGPTPARARLQPLAEVFSVVASLGLFAAAVHARGLSW